MFTYKFKIKLDIIAIPFNKISGLNIKNIIDNVNIPIIKAWILLNLSLPDIYKEFKSTFVNWGWFVEIEFNVLGVSITFIIFK